MKKITLTFLLFAITSFSYAANYNTIPFSNHNFHILEIFKNWFAYSNDNNCIGTPSEEECIQTYDLVCGCDGNTYLNECVATQSGIYETTEGLCPNSCTGPPFTGGCPHVYNPVCGCDGITYPNFCVATQNGIYQTTQGECPTSCTGNPYIGTCTTTYNPVCGCDGNNYPNACVAQQNGIYETTEGLCPNSCTGIPFGEVCIALYEPVCGCDGNTYGNECEAIVNGIYEYTQGACCFGEPLTENCVEIYEPVCGCDGNTYSNECVAHQNGVYNFSEGICPDILDSSDSCTDTPLVGECSREFEPVCGCDGNNYPNVCVAAQYGIYETTAGLCSNICTGPSFSSFCLTIPIPVCGCDGNTYIDLCAAVENGIYDFTQGACPIDAEVQIKVFLGGPYNATTGTMDDHLRISGNLPSVEPYSDLGFSVENADAEINSTVMAVDDDLLSIVDWVLLEVRAADNPSELVSAMAALVRRDGQVVHWEDGTSGITFQLRPDQQYEVAVRHRNHLGTMSNMTITLE